MNIDNKRIKFQDNITNNNNNNKTRLSLSTNNITKFNTNNKSKSPSTSVYYNNDRLSNTTNIKNHNYFCFTNIPNATSFNKMLEKKSSKVSKNNQIDISNLKEDFEKTNNKSTINNKNIKNNNSTYINNYHYPSDIINNYLAKQLFNNNNNNNNNLNKEIEDSSFIFENQLEYYLILIGYQIGYGGFWRFPYLVYSNGGAAFILAFVVLLFVISIPCFYIETFLGQIFRKAPIELLYSIHKKYIGLGYAMVILSFLLSIYYAVLLVWSYYFLFASFSLSLPWATKEYNINNIDNFKSVRENVNNNY